MPDIPATVLVVDDEPNIRELLHFHLEHAGYRVREAADGDAALRLARTRPDLIILDVMLPGLDGLEVCRRLRAAGDQVPVLMLTARSDEIDKVLGLETGADDYLTKPFGVRELLARVKALLRRRAVPAPGTGTVQYGQVEIDLPAGVVRRGGQVLPLTAIEYRLLDYFMGNPGRLLERRQILEAVWGPDFFGDERVLDVHVRHLREKIEEDPSQPARVVTVRGLGYRYDPPREGATGNAHTN